MTQYVGQGRMREPRAKVPASDPSSIPSQPCDTGQEPFSVNSHPLVERQVRNLPRGWEVPCTS